MQLITIQVSDLKEQQLVTSIILQQMPPTEEITLLMVLDLEIHKIMPPIRMTYRLKEIHIWNINKIQIKKKERIQLFLKRKEGK